MRVNTVYEGDCLEVMRGLPDNCIDTIITDPPYGLEFMGKNWDYGIPGIAYWREALRVAKPGATLMAFGGTRTHHRLMCAIEDAGWEIRDCIMWIYGSGFPKSLDIGKALDKQAGAERVVVGQYLQPCGVGKNGTQSIGGAWQDNPQITTPATPQAQEWDGWGTALKPSYEPIVVAMKPNEGSYADNALKWGVAGLNIDGGRVEYRNGLTPDDEQKKYPGKGGSDSAFWGNGRRQEVQNPSHPKGRWPANVIHDGSEEVEAEFAKAGVSVSRESNYNWEKSETNGDVKLLANYIKSGRHHNDTGTPSRFFYTAKASPSERGAYNNHPTVKPLELLKYLVRLTKTPTGGLILDPFAGSGTTALAAISEGRDYILIEKEPEYVALINRRIAEYNGQEIEVKEIAVAEETVKQLGLW